MDYKTILVHVDATKAIGKRLDFAFDLAREFDAHLAGLFAIEAIRAPSYAIAEVGQIIEASRRATAELEQRAHTSWNEAAHRAGWDKSEWRSSSADALDAVTLHARYADLVVIGQKDPDEGSGVSKTFEQLVLIAAGRPVFMVPYAFRQRPAGQNVLIAWNTSRESARAVVDALPLLRRAKQVHVATFNAGNGGDGHGDVPGADIGLWLARHDVRVTVSQFHTGETDIGGQLLSRAADLDVDTIVMGAYGHSRLAETIMGGATRSILEAMTVPVLMSH